MNRTVAQSNRFHALLTARKFDRDDKIELVKLYTNGRETSSANMTMDEMADAIKHLEDDQDKSINKMRSKIINIFRDIIVYPDPLKLQQSHWDALNKHLVKTCKKRLHELDYEGLRVAVTSMEKWRNSDTTATVASILGQERRKAGRPKKERV